MTIMMIMMYLFYIYIVCIYTFIYVVTMLLAYES